MRIAIRIVLAMLTLLAAWNVSAARRGRALDMPVPAEKCAVRM